MPLALLPILLTRANEPVPVHVLAQALWDDRLPTTGRTALQNHVLRLRRALGPDAGSRIRTRPPGYLIDVHDDELDLSRFIKLHDSARVACQQGAWAEAELLDELRLQAIELRTHAMLRLGLGGGSIRNSAPEAAAAPPTTPRAARPFPRWRAAARQWRSWPRCRPAVLGSAAVATAVPASLKPGSPSTANEPPVRTWTLSALPR
jgi:hypothetical protein